MRLDCDPDAWPQRVKALIDGQHSGAGGATRAVFGADRKMIMVEERFRKDLFMLPKYTIEYAARVREHAPTTHYGTDDPVACEEFLNELLDRGYRIRGIKHDGVDLPASDFDRMMKTAAGMAAAKRLCTSLGITSEEEKYRFGFGM